MSGLTIPTEIIEEVRIRALRWLEDRPRGQQSYSVFAARTGYSVSALKSFFSAEEGKVTAPIAQAIIESTPELGDGLVCRCCGRLVATRLSDRPIGVTFARR